MSTQRNPGVVEVQDHYATTSGLRGFRQLHRLAEQYKPFMVYEEDPSASYFHQLGCVAAPPDGSTVICARNASIAALLGRGSERTAAIPVFLATKRLLDPEGVAWVHTRRSTFDAVAGYELADSGMSRFTQMYSPTCRLAPTVYEFPDRPLGVDWPRTICEAFTGGQIPDARTSVALEHAASAADKAATDMVTSKRAMIAVSLPQLTVGVPTTRALHAGPEPYRKIHPERPTERSSRNRVPALVLGVMRSSLAVVSDALRTRNVPAQGR